MKLALSLSLSLFALFTFDDKSYSLTNYQIKQICKKEKRPSTCKKKPVPMALPPTGPSTWAAIIRTTSGKYGMFE